MKNFKLFPLFFALLFTQAYAIESAYNVEWKDKDSSMNFNPPQSFTVTDKDLFEKIESINNSDTPDTKLVIADPKTGRVFHLNTEMKVMKLDVIKPWTSTTKLQNLKTILNGMKPNKIEKLIRKKK